MSKLLEVISKEWNTLRQAPGTFALLTVSAVGAGFSLGALHYSQQIATLKEEVNVKTAEISAREGDLKTKDSQIQRYKVALGVVEPSQAALAELSDKELAQRSFVLVIKLRDIIATWNKRGESIAQAQKANKITRAQAEQERVRAKDEASAAFDTRMASDAHNIEVVLRQRLGPTATAHILGVPNLPATNGAQIPLTAFFVGTQMNAWLLGDLTNEIEQMAKLLDERK